MKFRADSSHPQKGMIGQNSQITVVMKKLIKSLNGSGSVFAHGLPNVKLVYYSLLLELQGCL